MGKVILSNAFSFQMIKSENGIFKFKKVGTEELANVDFTSAIGSEDLASILTNELGREVKMNRGNIELEEGDTLYVVSVIGGKLPIGSKRLPQSYKLQITKVSLVL